MIIFYSIMLPLACGLALFHIRWIRRLIEKPLSPVPWWVPVAGLFGSLVSISISTWNLVRMIG